MTSSRRSRRCARSARWCPLQPRVTASPESSYRVAAATTERCCLDRGVRPWTAATPARPCACSPVRSPVARAAPLSIGDASLSVRPMERIARPLRESGAHISTSDGHAPLVIEGQQPLRAIRHDLPVASAQVLGCLALAGLAAEGTTTIPCPDRRATTANACWPGWERRSDVTALRPRFPEGRLQGALDDRTWRYLVCGGMAGGRCASSTCGRSAGGRRPEPFTHRHHRGAAGDGRRYRGREPDADATAGPEPVGRITVRGGRQLRASASSAIASPTSSTSCRSSAWPWPPPRDPVSCAMRPSCGSRNRIASHSW